MTKNVLIEVDKSYENIVTDNKDDTKINDEKEKQEKIDQNSNDSLREKDARSNKESAVKYYGNKNINTRDTGSYRDELDDYIYEDERKRSPKKAEKNYKKIEKIYGMKIEGNQKLFQVKYVGEKEPTIIDGAYIRKHHPKILISFYEEHIQLYEEECVVPNH